MVGESKGVQEKEQEKNPEKKKREKITMNCIDYLLVNYFKLPPINEGNLAVEWSRFVRLLFDNGYFLSLIGFTPDENFETYSAVIEAKDFDVLIIAKGERIPYHSLIKTKSGKVYDVNGKTERDYEVLGVFPIIRMEDEDVEG